MVGEDGVERRDRVVDAFWAYASRQSDLGRRFARRSGMHTTDSTAVVEILRAEERGEQLTPARLAERIGLTSGATSILLNRLEEAGHVTRTRGHVDRRLVTLHSTAAVHERAETFFAPLRAAFAELTAGYTDEQLALVEEFAHGMGRVLDAFDGTLPPS